TRYGNWSAPMNPAVVAVYTSRLPTTVAVPFTAVPSSWSEKVSPGLAPSTNGATALLVLLTVPFKSLIWACVGAGGGGSTMNGCALTSEPPGVLTVMVPVTAPVGTLT